MITSKKIKLIVGIIVLIAGYFINQNPNDNSIQIESTDQINIGDFNYLPTSTTGVIVKHDGYQLSYNEKREQAEWVAYSLSKEDIRTTKINRPYFINDPKVKTRSANYKSYKKSGYDKGHLCPAADKKHSIKAYKETFYTSNISPQRHSFNAGIWRKLEEKSRYWAKKYDKIYIITGGILKDDLRTIGRDKVSIPTEFYKIILDYTGPEVKAIAFLIPHKKSTKPLYDYVISIDDLEEKTGIDFFPALPDDIEEKLESSSNYKAWSFR
ncbi:DNA/RNA non-specific endonuclease [Tenacibaculum pacificus]|uniref:DNA/RNA non-specific endonuclease n=1 Tax=Tenacibaculum pacificus TaxID=3018314 RepID=UPI0022F40797|nr:DNA/RNA non-specific endonuclease [Tenacibaculum pacificus]WBX73414.1 DNA/RNA non-specific endonuclease [Tenacibaculum pacificus]